MERPLVSVCLCVRKGGREGGLYKHYGQVLLHLRRVNSISSPYNKFPYAWTFLGGHLELYESFADCALRELAEEAGGNLKVTDPIMWTVENTIFKDEGRHYVVIMMIADWISGEPKVVEPEKCECWEWFCWNKLPGPLMQGIQNLVDKRLNSFWISASDCQLPSQNKWANLTQNWMEGEEKYDDSQDYTQ